MQEYLDGPEEAIDGLVLETAGFLVRDTGDTVSVGMDYNPGRTPQWRHVANIPRSYIVEMLLLTV